jgi:drug/metabolite transporter (DMT)-like permease
VVKGGLDDASPLCFLAIRFGAAALLLLPFVARPLRGLSRRTARRGAVLGLLLFAGFATQTIGLRYTTTSKSAFITGMLVVLTPIFQLAIERRPPRLGNVLGIALVAGGLYLLTSPAGSALNLGDALTLACAAGFALYIVYLDLFTQEEDPTLLLFLQLSLAAALSLASALLFEDLELRPTAALLLATGYLTVFASLLALWLQAKWQRHTSPTRAAIIFSLEPVIAAFLGWWVRGEELGPAGIAGGAAIVAGVLVSELWDALVRRAGTATRRRT